jgi:hypothetical protein
MFDGQIGVDGKIAFPGIASVYRKWQDLSGRKWTDEFILKICRLQSEAPIERIAADVDPEKQWTALETARETRAVKIRAVNTILSIKGESDPETKKLAVQTYTDAAGAFDVVDGHRVYDLESTRLALQELNKGAFKELAQTDPNKAQNILENMIAMLDSVDGSKVAWQNYVKGHQGREL